MWYAERQDLIEFGLARFMGEGPEIIVEEPLALMSVLRYFEKEGLTPDDFIRDRMQVNKGVAFEEAVLLACTRLFRRGARLDQVFRFHGETPPWARQSASIVTRGNGDTLNDFDIPNGDPVVPSNGIAFIADDPEDVKKWMKLMHTGWCLPGQNAGPDLMAWLRLSDGRLLLLLFQAKCYLTGNLDTIAAAVLAKAIRSLIPNEFFSCLVRTVSPLPSSLTVVYRRAQPPSKRSMICLKPSTRQRIVLLERGTMFCVSLLHTH
jgi:hypothetical protein